MSGLPRIAEDLLQLFGVDAALIGNLDESARAGRSRWWCWYQVAGVLCLWSWRLAATRPVYAIRGTAVGWSVLLDAFMLIDSPAINHLRLAGYRTDEWTAFWPAASVLPYVGLASRPGWSRGRTDRLLDF
jgi:hypothetical protein